MKKFLALLLLTSTLVLAGSSFITPVTTYAQTPPATPPPEAKADNGCGFGIPDMICKLIDLPDQIMKAAGNLVLWLTSWVLWLVGIFLNLVISITIINGSKLLGEVGVINTAWALFRDITNLAGIFILLYISFQLILGIGSDQKRTIGWLILMALLINFSLFFTKVVIDASNIIAIGFYDKLAPQSTLSLNPSSWDGGLSAQFMKKLNLKTLYAPPDPSNPNLAAQAALNMTKGYTYVTATVMGSLFIIIAAFVFAAIAVLLLIRFVILIFLMMLSPLAFAAYVLPSTRSYFSKWWTKLIHQAFFAPILFLFLWLTLELTTGLSNSSSLSAVSANTSLVEVLQRQATAPLYVVFNYCIIIFFMLYSVVLAHSLGAGGAATMMKWGKNMRDSGKKYATRNTVGRGARALMDSEAAKGFASKNPRMGQALYGNLKNVAGKAGGGFDKQEKDKVKNRAEFVDAIAAKPKTPPRRGEGFTGAPPVIATTRLSGAEQTTYGSTSAHASATEEKVKTLEARKQQLINERQGFRQDAPDYQNRTAQITNIENELKQENLELEKAQTSKKRLEEKATGLGKVQHLDSERIAEYGTLHDDLHADTVLDSKGNGVASTSKLRRDAEDRMKRIIESRKGLDPSSPTYAKSEEQEIKLQEELKALKAKDEASKQRFADLEKAGEARRKEVAPTEDERATLRVETLKQNLSNDISANDRQISQQALKEYEKKAAAEAKEKKKDADKKKSEEEEREKKERGEVTKKETGGASSNEDIEDMQEKLKKQAEEIQEMKDKMEEGKS